MHPLTEADLAWLEGRVGTHRWSPEDCRRMLADLRAARLADWKDPTSDPAWLEAAARLKETVRGTLYAEGPCS
jgi:hypothetical protein